MGCPDDMDAPENVYSHPHWIGRNGMLWIGIDVGGTFTDAVVYDDEKGTFEYAKAPSTPGDPSAGVLAVIAQMGLDLTLSSASSTVSPSAPMPSSKARAPRSGCLS